MPGWPSQLSNFLCHDLGQTLNQPSHPGALKILNVYQSGENDAMNLHVIITKLQHLSQFHFLCPSTWFPPTNTHIILKQIPDFLLIPLQEFLYLSIKGRNSVFVKIINLIPLL